MHVGQAEPLQSVTWQPASTTSQLTAMPASATPGACSTHSSPDPQVIVAHDTEPAREVAGGPSQAAIPVSKVKQDIHVAHRTQRPRIAACESTGRATGETLPACVEHCDEVLDLRHQR